jgi:hypothetical protein
MQAEPDLNSLVQAADRALQQTGDLHTSRKAYATAYDVAERAGEFETMARAAIGLGGLWVHEQRAVTTASWVRARQRRALLNLEPDSVLALRLRARLAGESDYRKGEHAEILALVAEARRLGDPVARAETLSFAHHCLMAPEHATLRRAIAVELIEVAASTNRRSDLLIGLLWHSVDLLLAGDRHVERHMSEIRAALARQEHYAVAFIVSAIDVMLAIRAGRFEEAEKAALLCAEVGAAAGDLDVAGWYGGQLIAIRWYQGRLGEFEGEVADLVHSPTLSTVDSSYFAALAVAAADKGDRLQAMAALARLGSPDLADLPRSSTWMVTLNGVIQAAYLLGEVETAATAYRLLRPFADLPMIASMGVTCFGSTHHGLGIASLATGNRVAAVNHLRAAVQANLALAHWPAVTMSRWYLALALADRGGRADVAEARELREQARREAAELGMVLPEAAAAEAGAQEVAAHGGGVHGDGVQGDGVQADGASAAGARRSAAEPDAQPRPKAGARPGSGAEAAPDGLIHCRRRGRHWMVELNSATVMVAHSVGMTHLAVLLANPGRPIAAIDLVAGAKVSSGPDAGSSGRSAHARAEVAGGSESAQPLLDQEAKRAYRERLAAITAEIDLWAPSRPDLVAKAETERDWLMAELSAATGLSGRERQFTGAQERARISVGKAVRRALDRITALSPELGEELKNTVQTGMWCCYRPL